ncbi:MAG: BtpA/SgcQ family protein [Candidatus Eisenbacteria bacterium]|uniref:BtpA/SgcQ family protein n=1 Tax=Eiseniibacteriota bacterium TaxID=2212470 RepID=A0A956NAX1_UNCEI|nr:BtpA/SgcQ family protein [Candidatus Eisenbacteria bacterium]MCB9463901.1 BtpA/SgcQ family protein [Candidatus Eisenbacteria bacterium]
MKPKWPFPTRRPVLGVVHLDPLPGAPGFRGKMDEVQRRALEDARCLTESGFDGLIVENFGDAPFFKDDVPAVTVAAMTAVIERIRSQCDVPLGVNVLRNDVCSALSIAAATGASFVRVNVHVGAAVTDQGLIEGRAAEALRLRDAIAPSVQIFADFRVKHAAPLVDRPWEEELADLAERGKADAVLLTGGRTGAAPDQELLARARAAIKGVPLFVASGTTVDNVAGLFPLVDGLIVGSALEKRGRAGNPVDAERARAFLSAARAAEKRR